MLANKNHRILVNASSLYLICILLMFLAAVSTRNGLVIFITFLITSLFIVMRYKNLESLSPYFVALLMNNALVEYQIGLFGTTTLTGVIKFYFIIYFLISFLKIQRSKKRVIGFGFLTIWLFYFAINAVINQTGVGSTLFSLSFPMLVCVVMQSFVLKKDKHKILLISGILSGFVFLCMCGYLELIIGKTFFYSIWTGAERYRLGFLRVGSTVSDPNFFALTELFSICFISIPFVKRLIGNRISILLTYLGIISIILTFSRTGIIALVVATVLMISKKGKKYIVVLLPVLALIAVPIISFVIGSVESMDVNSYISRNRVVEVAVEMWRRNPLLGNGQNSFYNISQSYIGNQRSTMNEYVGELVNYGLIGLGFFISYFVLLFRRCIGGFEKLFSNENTIYYLAIIVSWLLMSYSLDTYYKILIWVLPSLVISIESLSMEGEMNV